MAQETVMDIETASIEHKEVLNEALVVCRGCNHLVPKTMMCLYCGAPILFKKPRTKT